MRPRGWQGLHRSCTGSRSRSVPCQLSFRQRSSHSILQATHPPRPPQDDESSDSDTSSSSSDSDDEMEEPDFSFNAQVRACWHIFVLCVLVFLSWWHCLSFVGSRPSRPSRRAVSARFVAWSSPAAETLPDVLAGFDGAADRSGPPKESHELVLLLLAGPAEGPLASPLNAATLLLVCLRGFVVLRESRR